MRLSNNAFDRAAGSQSLAEAGRQCEPQVQTIMREPSQRRMKNDGAQNGPQHRRSAPGFVLIAWWAGLFLWIPAFFLANILMLRRATPTPQFFTGIPLTICAAVALVL